MAKQAYELKGNHTAASVALPSGKVCVLDKDHPTYETSDTADQRELDQAPAVKRVDTKEQK